MSGSHICPGLFMLTVMRQDLAKWTRLSLILLKSQAAFEFVILLPLPHEDYRPEPPDLHLEGWPFFFFKQTKTMILFIFKI